MAPTASRYRPPRGKIALTNRPRSSEKIFDLFPPLPLRVHFENFNNFGSNLTRSTPNINSSGIARVSLDLSSGWSSSFGSVSSSISAFVLSSSGSSSSVSLSLSSLALSIGGGGSIIGGGCVAELEDGCLDFSEESGGGSFSSYSTSPGYIVALGRMANITPVCKSWALTVSLPSNAADALATSVANISAR